MNATADFRSHESTSRLWIALLGARTRFARIFVERLHERDDPSDLDRWDDEGGQTVETPQPETP